MNMSNPFKMIPWIYKIQGAILDNGISNNRLSFLSDYSQKSLVFKTMETFSEYFALLPDYYEDPEMPGFNQSEDIDGVSSTMLTWLNGLGDVSISQIIGGLLDIINLKTEYKKFPPKSVIEFHAVCKRPRAAYHELKTSSDFLRIENIPDISTVKPENIDELDSKGRRLYDKRSGNKIEYHPVHGKRLFTVKTDTPNDRVWWRGLSSSMKEKVFNESIKSWISLKCILDYCEDSWSYLDDGFERSPWFKPMVEAYRSYNNIEKFKELK